MSKPKKLSLAVIGLTALVVVYYAVGRRGAEAPAPPVQATLEKPPAVTRAAPPPAAPASPRPATVPDAPAVIARSSGAVERVAPPPPAMRRIEPRKPIKELDASLREVALNGDAQASCRLAVELIRCVRIDYRLAMHNAARNALAQLPPDSEKAVRMKQELDDTERMLKEDRSICGSGVPQSYARDAWRYLYLAAQAGNVAAMSQFARDPGLDPRDETAKEAWEIFSRRAPAFLEAAIQGGDVKALYQGWLSAWTGTSPSGGKVFERDPEKALQYGLVVVGMIDPQRAEQVAKANDAMAYEIGPERAARARQEADKLRAAHFTDTTGPIEWGGPDNGFSDANDCLK